MRRGWLAKALLTGGVLGALFIIVWPRTLHDGSFSSEVRVMAAIRTIHTAQTQYYSQYNRYAMSLAELAPLVGDKLAKVAESGYRLSLAGTGDKYSVSAMPVSFIPSRTRTFYSDQTMTVHEHRGPEPATAYDPELK